MFRFGFPGFAEVEWVLPRDVQHDEPWYEALPPVFGCQDVVAWSLDPRQHDKLRALHEEAIGETLDKRDMWPRIRTQARYFVEVERTWKGSVERYQDVYGRALAAYGRSLGA